MITRETVSATTKTVMEPIKRPVLSILIASLTERESRLLRLMEELHRQINEVESLVEVHVITDNRENKVGAKRQALLIQSTGKYVCFVDDDDGIAPDYVKKITEALKQKPDAVGFCARRLVNGQHVGQLRYSIANTEWTYVGESQRVGLRTITHLCPVRRELALQAGFDNRGWGEDRGYAFRLMPLLKTQVFIDEELYVYDYDGEKTAWDKDVAEHIKAGGGMNIGAFANAK